MKIIDLYNKIANGEEMPKKIKFRGKIYTYNSKTNWYGRKIDTFYNGYEDLIVGKNGLNDTVEILEEEPRDIEICGSWFTKSEYDNLFRCEEEKKIPEKLKSLNNVGNVPNLVEFADKQQLNNHLLKDKLNELIDYLDYLKSKGDE